MNEGRLQWSIARRLVVPLAAFTVIMSCAGARAATIEIDGVIDGAARKWVLVGGSPATNVAVQPGDTVTWKALVPAPHGVVFDTQAIAEGVLTFQTGGGLPALGPQTVGTELVWGTAPQPPVGTGTTLARATVKTGVATGTILGFFCSQHGRMMSGSLAVSGISTTTSSSTTSTTSTTTSTSSTATTATSPTATATTATATSTSSTAPTSPKPTTTTTAPPVSNESPKDPGGLDDPRIKRVVRAEVVALDQPFMCNRLGTAMPQGMVFALKRDVISNTGNPSTPLGAGCVTLRPAKRARPIVLRANVGDCLEVTFTNLLSPNPSDAPVETPATRAAGVHVAGMELLGSVGSDASYVGLNLNGETPATGTQCNPGETKIYRFFARAEGTFLLYSAAADMGKGLDAGQLTAGLFGSVVVEPQGAEWYRSQVTERDLALASKAGGVGKYGHPVIDYDAMYPPGTAYEDLAPDGSGKKTPIPTGTPILKMTKPATSTNGKPALEIVASDLTAIVTGPKRGLLPDTGGRPNPVYPDARQPYREFSIHYHDALTAVQAFNEFNPSSDSTPGSEKRLRSALSAGLDNFAINYGMAGIGAEIWANRLKLGPMANSAEAKFEEFFLSSWVVGDPAMLVDHPANSAAHPAPTTPPVSAPAVPTDFPSAIKPGSPPSAATRVFFPDDPSNVYHSYLNDHVRFRIMHAGGNIAHVHHLHAHQWLRTPDSDESLLLDSQTITPADGFTQDIIYGSGNRNLTVGDAIFHCHFYPHFAQGMWSLWRVHDVFEAGTKLGTSGVPTPDARALPDGEIAAGTPIPALVPIPALPMAPIPAPTKIERIDDPKTPGTFSGFRAVVADPKDTRNPGYPFFIPGVGGRRAPHPPKDFAADEATGEKLDGGLPRHIVLGGDVSYEKHNAYDFTKESSTLSAVQLPEDGTPEEGVAMSFHAQAAHPTDTPEGKTGKFQTNGKPAISGAPYADPTGGPFTKPEDLGGKVVYKAADVQLDVVLNKKGWHFPQQRILTLWGDVRDTLEGRRAPEPFFFRANSGDVVEYWQANLVPDVYELDDFQVRTPTDVIGQHIHLVKFDVTSSDGSANGFNYEDGTFSPDEVRSRITAITTAGGIFQGFGATAQKPLKAKSIPFFGPGPDGRWVGAQATIQRWYADPIRDNPALYGKPRDRTLRSVFTHDHLSPSTHQQAGLYAGLLIEPKGSSWSDSSTGTALAGRTAAPYDSAGTPTKDGGPTSWQAIIASADKSSSYREFALELQDSQLAYRSNSKSDPKAYAHYTGAPPVPWGWMDTDHAVTPVPMIRGTDSEQPSLITTGPEIGTRSLNYRSEPLELRIRDMDPSHGFASIQRRDTTLNGQGNPGNPVQPGSKFKFPAAFTGAGPFDPYTPLLRAYENDDVQVRVLIGAHFLPHSFNLHGLKWLTEAGDTDSGYVSTQVMSISEHFEMLFRLPPTAGKQLVPTTPPAADYLYLASSDTRGLLKGDWGILRAYQGKTDQLAPIPTNPAMAAPSGSVTNIQNFYNGLIAAKKVRNYNVFAVKPTAVLNADGSKNNDGLVYYERGDGKLNDTDAVIYVTDEVYDPSANKFLPGFIPEPLVLRANAGDLIRVKLTNKIPLPDGQTVGQRAGLHPQLVSYDVTTSDGFNAGNNQNQTAEKPGDSVQYEWYAGNLRIDPKGKVTGEPVEFGAVNLEASDPASSPTSSQINHGLFGALLIEPEGSTWLPDTDSRAQATVTLADGKTQFRECALMIQDFVPATKPKIAMQTQGVNYKTETMGLRFDVERNEDFPDYNAAQIVDATSDFRFVGTSDPQTPICHAPQSLPVRFRVLHPGGGSYTPLNIHGHVWKQRPTKQGTESRVLGTDSPSLFLGSLGGVPPNSQFNILLDSAGGGSAIPGDYLYRGFQSTELQYGLWGLFRVGEKNTDDLAVQAVTQVGKQLTAKGRVWKKLGAPTFARSIALSSGGSSLGQANIDPSNGSFQITATVAEPFGVYQLTSSDGGTARVEIQPTKPVVVRPLAVRAGDRRAFDVQRFLPQSMPLGKTPED